MPFDPAQHTGRLPRLPAEFYRGRAFVLWTMAIESRATGWLDEAMHCRIREWLCHSLVREGIACPAYVLMPDHGHFVWIGCSKTSDQRRAVLMFRRVWNAVLRKSGRALQRQAHDHVLRESERERGALSAVARYVFENPVRAGLARDWRDYPHLGAMLPGYPDLDPREPDYWDRFWRIYERLTAPRDGEIEMVWRKP